MADFRRKRNRLSLESYTGRKAYFLTLCAQERRTVFVDSVVVNLVLDVLRSACARYLFNVHAYCFMPDHLHLILTGESESSNLRAMVQAFKSRSAIAGGELGVFDLWQKGFYDHVLRSGESMEGAAWYVFMNPVRAGLVKRIEDWEFSGSFVFEWKRVAVPKELFVPLWKNEKGHAAGEMR